MEICDIRSRQDTEVVSWPSHFVNFVIPEGSWKHTQIYSSNYIFPEKPRRCLQLTASGSRPIYISLVMKFVDDVLVTGLPRTLNFYSTVFSLSHFSYSLTQSANPLILLMYEASVKFFCPPPPKKKNYKSRLRFRFHPNDFISSLPFNF